MNQIWNCNFSEMTVDGAALRSYLGTKQSRAPSTVISLKLQLLPSSKAFAITTLSHVVYYKQQAARRPAMGIATKFFNFWTISTPSREGFDPPFA